MRKIRNKICGKKITYETALEDKRCEIIKAKGITRERGEQKVTAKKGDRRRRGKKEMEIKSRLKMNRFKTKSWQ